MQSTVVKMINAKDFVQKPPFEVSETFKKHLLMQIERELQLEVKRSTCHYEFKGLIVEQLVDKGLLPDSCSDVYTHLPIEPSGKFEIRQSKTES